MPSYIVNVTNVAQIQLAVNFARSLNLRLSVKGQGHDFNSKNIGAGSLSIWTVNLNDIEYLGPEYRIGNFSGPALKIGAGVRMLQVYEYANSIGLDVVGGIARVGARQFLKCSTLCMLTWRPDCRPQWRLYRRRWSFTSDVSLRYGC